MSGKINKLYTSAVKCDDQQQYKAILEASIVSTTGIFTDNSPISPGPSVTVINPSARKSLCLFNEVLDSRNKTAVLWVGDTNQIVRQSDHAVCCGRILQKREDIQKPMNKLRNIFIFVFYSILRLCSIKLLIIALNILLMVALNHSWFQNCYRKYLSGNFII